MMQKLDEYRRLPWSTLVDRWLTDMAAHQGELAEAIAQLPSYETSSGMTEEDRRKYVEIRINYCIRRDVATTQMMSRVLHKLLAEGDCT